jgi:HD-GYP domain-containing protein (c-di-GMP phosphodiesterase class II)
MSRPAELVSALAAARKATQFYPAEHPRFVEAIDELVSAVNDCAAEGSFLLNLHQGRLYSGSDVLTDDGPSLTSIVESMEARKIESLTFLPGFRSSDARALTEVLNLRPSPQLDIEAELAARGVSTVQVANIVESNTEIKEERDRERERDKALYRRFAATLRNMTGKLQQGADIDLAEANGLVPEIMSRLMENQAAVLGLATIRSRSEAELFHSINVMIYSLTIAAALNLPEEGFASLGVCALTHDLGKAAFGPDDDSETVRLYHPKAGGDILARLPGDDRAPMLVAFEHHMGIDGSGWPEREPGYFPHPYSRMVAIADRYESLTKSPSGPGLTPDRAVAQLLHDATTWLDPIFTRLFVQALGVFPVGCWVRLSDHSVGVVAGKGNDPLNPKVRMVYDERGLEFEEPFELDIASDGREIVEVVDETQLAVAASDHL